MKNIKKYISPLLTIFVLLLFGIYLYNNPEILVSLKETNPIYIFLIMALYLFIFYLEALFILVTLMIFKRDIDSKEGMYISVLSRIGNYLLPLRAGAVFRATYLKKKYNFEYSNFLSTLYGYYIIFFLTNSILAFLVLLFKGIVLNQTYTTLLLFFLLIILFMLFLIIFNLPLVKIEKRSTGILKKLISFLSKFLNGWKLIVKERKSFLKLLLLAFGNIFVNTIIIYIEFVSIEKIPKILDVVLYTCISGLSLFVSITPGSLGIREGVLLLTSQSIGISETEIVRLAILDRGIMFVLLLICMILIYIFVKRFNLKEVFLGKEKDI